MTAVAPSMVRLGGRVTLTLEKLDSALSEVGGKCSALVLFVDGSALTGLPPTQCDRESGEVSFVLHRMESDMAAWREILGAPTSFDRMAHLTLGTSPFLSYPNMDGTTSVQLVQIPRAACAGFAGFACCLIVAVVLLARRSGLLRESGGLRHPAQSTLPYSLSRAQHLFWLVLSVLGYVFVWLMTTELNSLTPSVLMLLGLSSTTAIAGESLTAQHGRSAAVTLTELRKKKAEAQAGADEAGVDSQAASAHQRGLVDQIHATVGAHQCLGCRGFFQDVLGGTGTVDLHRLQSLVWTLVLGGAFVREVYESLSMPNFGPEALSLMGLSAGGYLAGKTVQAKAKNPAQDCMGSSTGP